MSIFIAIIVIISLIFGILNKSFSSISSSFIESSTNAVELLISIIGVMMFWGGMMNIVKKSKLDDKIACFLKPFLKLIFSSLDFTKRSAKAISLNITANLLGIGNAATPLGIEAMKELQKDENVNTKPSKNMEIFTVLNTASIQIIPTTIATIRVKYNSANPFEIIPPIVISSLMSVVISVLAVKLFYRN